MTVEGPGGISVDFPDGTDPGTIDRVMREAVGGAASTESGPRQAGSMLEEAARPITSYLGHQNDLQREARVHMQQGLDQLREPTDGDLLGSAGAALKGVGNLAGGAVGYLASPFNAAYRSFAGKPLEETVGIPKEYTEFALGLATPIPTKLPTLGRSAPRAAGNIAREQAFEAADRNYEAARSADFAVAPDMTEMLKGQFRDSLMKKGFRETNPAHAPLFNAIDELPTGRYADVSDFDSVRQTVRESGAPSKGVRTVMGGIDDFLAPKVPEIAIARGDFAAGSRSKDFGEAMERAGRGAGNTAVQTQARALRNNKKDMLGWNDEEKAQLDKIITGSRTRQLLEGAGSALGGNGGPMTGLLGITTLGAAPTVGYTLKKLADIMTSSQVAKLDKMLLSRAPEAQRLAKPMEDFGKIAQEAEVSPSARNLSRLMIASRNLSTNLKDFDVTIAPNEILKSLFGQKKAAADDNE
jgi:hypothetical protein